MRECETCRNLCVLEGKGKEIDGILNLTVGDLKISAGKKEVLRVKWFPDLYLLIF